MTARIRRIAIWALPLTAVLSVGLTGALLQRVPRQKNLGYVVDGELLLHGMRGVSLYSLPSADVLAALLYSHWGLSFRFVHGACALILAVLVFAIDETLGVPIFFGLAPAVAAVFYHAAYVQLFLALFVLLTAGYLIRYVRAPSYSGALLLALAIGSGFLFRSTMAFLPPALALFSAVFWVPGRRRTRAGHALVLLLVPYFFTLPVLRTNYALHHRFIPFENGEASCNIVTGALGVVQTIEGPWEEALVPGKHGFANGGVLRWAVREIIRHPLRYASAYLLRLGAVIGWSSPAIFFALWALWTWRKRKEFQALGVLAAYWIGIHCLMSVEEGYFQPLQPLLILLACSLAGRFAPMNLALPRRFSSGVLAGSLAAFLLLDHYSVRLMRNAGKTTLDQAAALNPDDWWLRKKQGEENLKRGAYPEAAADLSRSVALMPPHILKTSIGRELEAQVATVEMIQNRLAPAWEPADDGAWPQENRMALLRAAGWLRAGRRAKAEGEVKIAMDRYASTSRVRGPRDARGDEVLERLRAADNDGLSDLIEQDLKALPIADKTALAAVMVSVDPRSVPVWIIYADCLKQRGSRARYRAALARAAALAPTPRQRRRLAGAFSGDGDYARGLEQLEAIPGPRDADLLIEISRARAGLGQKAASRLALDQAAALGPDPGERRRLAEAYSAGGDFERALAQLESIPGPKDVDLLIEIARVRVRLGRKESALSALAQAAGLGPGPGRRRRLAEEYSAAGDFKGELEQLEALPGTRDAATLIEISRARARLGQKEAAISALIQAAGRSPSPSQRRLLAAGFSEAGDIKRVLEQLEAIPGPRDADLLIEIAAARVRLGQKESALSALVQAESLGPDASQRRRLADGYAGAGDFKHALEQFAAVPGPRDADSLIAEARVRIGLGQTEAASAVLERARRMSPGRQQGYEIALIYQDLKDYDRALSVLDELTAASPRNVDFLVSRGVCEYLSGAVDRAAASLKKAIELDSKFLSAYLTLGYIYEEQRRYGQAAELYEAALSKSPDQPGDPMRRSIALALQRTKAASGGTGR